MSNLVLTKNPLTRMGNTNFPGLNHNLGSPRATSSYLGDESPRLTNTTEDFDEDERSALALRGVEHSNGLQSPLKFPKNGVESLGERERSSRSERECF